MTRLLGATADSASSPASTAPAGQRTWARIAEELTRDIASGTYAPGSRLPSEHALAERFDVNRHTVRRSLASLSSRGLVRVAQGSGSFVEPFAIDLMLGKRTRHQRNLALVGLQGGFQVLASSVVRAPALQARALGLAARAQVLWVQMLGQAQQQTLQVSERWFPLPRFAGLDELVRASGSISTAFAHLGVSDYTRRNSRIQARLPAPEIAAHLQQPVTRPVLVVQSVNVDLQGTPVEFSQAWFPGDQITLCVDHDEG